MADKELPSITAATSIAGSDLLYAVIGSNSRKITVANFFTSPTLVTPALGVATGTSLALGGATLGSNALAVNGQVTNAGGTITTSQPFTITQTWNASGTVFTGALLNFTNTASATLSKFIDIQVGGNSQFAFGFANGSTATMWAGIGGALTANNYIIAATSTDLFINAPGSGNAITFSTANGVGLFSISGGTGRPVSMSSTSSLGFTAGNAGSALDASLSRQAVGVIQFGTTAGTATGAWLAAKGTLTGGTLADQAQVLAITATQPTTITAEQSAVKWIITSAGSSNQANEAFYLNYAAGYTGSSATFGLNVDNQAAGAGATLINVAGSGPVANIGQYGTSLATTAGTNIGIGGFARGGNVNSGLIGIATTAKNSATNIGVTGTGLNTGTSPVQIGGFFSLNQTTVPTVSAALIADNGAQTDAIFLARDNNTTIFSIIDGGFVGIGVAASTSTQMNVVAGTTAKSQLRLAASTAPTSPVDGDVWFDGTNIFIRVSGATKTFTII